MVSLDRRSFALLGRVHFVQVSAERKDSQKAVQRGDLRRMGFKSHGLEMVSDTIVGVLDSHVVRESEGLSGNGPKDTLAGRLICWFLPW